MNVEYVDPYDKNKIVRIFPRDIQFYNVINALKAIADEAQKVINHDWIHPGLLDRIRRFLSRSYDHRPGMMNREEHYEESNHSSSGSKHHGIPLTINTINSSRKERQQTRISSKRRDRKRLRNESQNEDEKTKKAKRIEERKKNFLDKIKNHIILDMDKDKRSSFKLKINESLTIKIKCFQKTKMDFQKKAQYDRCHFYFSVSTSSNYVKLKRKNAVGLLVGIGSGADGGKARLWHSNNFKKKMRNYSSRRDKINEIKPEWLIDPIIFYLNILSNGSIQLILKRDDVKQNKYWCITSESEIASRFEEEIDTLVLNNFALMKDETIYHQFETLVIELLKHRKEKDNDKKIELGICEKCKNLILVINDQAECRWDCWELGTVIVDELMGPPKKKKIKMGK